MEKLTVIKAAEILRCHPETIRRLDRKGILKSKRDYRGYRIFDLDDLLKVKEQREKLMDPGEK